MSEALDLAPPRRVPAWLPQLARFVVLAAAFFVALYYPYSAHSLPARMLHGYVRGVAVAAAWMISLLDASSMLIDGMVISGRFPLKIVLDCTALDVEALYAAAVLAAPASWRDRAIGLVAGLSVLSLANLARIGVLYLAGVYAPAQFDLLHEDVLAFALLICTCFAFYTFSRLSAAR